MIPHTFDDHFHRFVSLLLRLHLHRYRKVDQNYCLPLSLILRYALIHHHLHQALNSHSPPSQLTREAFLQRLENHLCGYLQGALKYLHLGDEIGRATGLVDDA